MATYQPEGLASQGYAPPGSPIAFSVPAGTAKVWHLDVTVGGTITITGTFASGASWAYQLKDVGGNTITGGAGAVAFSGTLVSSTVSGPKRYWLRIASTAGTVTGTFTPANGTGTIAAAEAFGNESYNAAAAGAQVVKTINAPSLPALVAAAPLVGQIWPRGNP